MEIVLNLKRKGPMLSLLSVDCHDADANNADYASPMSSVDVSVDRAIDPNETLVARDAKRLRPGSDEEDEEDTLTTAATSVVTSSSSPAALPPRPPAVDAFIRTHDLSLDLANESQPSPSLLATLHDEQSVASIVRVLHEVGKNAALDESNAWTPVRDTEKILAKRAKNGHGNGSMRPNAAMGTEVLVWSRKCWHDGHGKEYPVVKARGMIAASAADVVALLLDSDRVKSYNKYSLGRTDEHVFASDRPSNDDDDGKRWCAECPRSGIVGVAKIMRSRNQPPLVRKPLVMRALVHARRIDAMDADGGGDENDGQNSNATKSETDHPPNATATEIETYVVASRSVWETPEGTRDERAPDASSTTRCEMMLGVHLVRSVPGCDGETWCEITVVTHTGMPGIPIFLAKKAGLVAAGKFVRDLRSACEKK